MTNLLRFLATSLIAASLQAAAIRGVVRDESGAPLPGVTIYEKGASDVAVTDESGRFSLEVASLPATIVAFLGGFDSTTATANGGEVAIALKLAAMTQSVTVTASAPRSATTSTYDLRPLEVLRTPGAQADVFRALQTLPGVAKVDDGAGLFVRGGDVSEVRVLLDGTTIAHPFRHESPAGGQFGSIPPMLLEGLAFSTGGFSARYGNALSAVLDLRGLGRPSAPQTIATGGLAGISGRVGVPAGETAGMRASGNFSSTELLFAVNGSPRQFDRMPESWDLNVGAYVDSACAGSLKVFVMTQHDSVGVSLQQESFDGFLHSSSDHSLGTANWKKAAGAWQLTAAFGADRYVRRLDAGVLDLSTTDHRLTTRFDAARVIGGAVVRAGADADRTETRIEGVKSLRGHDFNGAGGSIAFDVDYGDLHAGAYAEVEKTFGRFTPTIGIRADGDRLLGAMTFDPRVNVAVALSPQQKLRFAWGLFHQAPAAQYFDRVTGTRELEAMEAEHWIAGYELGAAEGPLFVRVEAYQKTYRALPLEDALRGFTSDGYGFARGIDFFAAKKWARFDVRASYSLLTSRRRWTPADQQQRFELPAGVWRPDFDIPRTLSVVANAQLTPLLSAGMAFTSASGKPNTPIVGAREDAFGLSPVYGAVNSERFPRYERCDLNLTYRPRVSGKTTLLYFAAVSNLFARQNSSDYLYSPDFSSRVPVVDAAPRSFYAGFTIIR